jgi:hypothetical protein
MNTSLNQASAKIYAFPVGGRASLNGRRGGNKPVVETTRCDAAFDSWYHEAAVQESEQDRKR